MGTPETSQTPTNPQINNSLISFDQVQIDLIKRTIAKGATDDELKLFLYQAGRTGLDPLARQIYFQKFNSNISIITSIDGYRLSASRSGEYAGCDDAVFDNEKNPTKGTVTVYRIVKGVRCPFPATARWQEYYPGDGSKGFMWRKMPCTMLAKVAEALALRKAFPAELSGIYTKEEMEQAEAEGQDDSHKNIQKPAAKNEQKVIDIKLELKDEQKVVKPDSTYNGTDEDLEKLTSFLSAQGISNNYWDEIHRKMIGQHKSHVAKLISEINENGAF